MLVIRNLEDLARLFEAQEIDNELEANIYDYIHFLQAELDEIALGEFSVEDTSQIVVLQVGDDVRNLAEIGLNPEDHGLLGVTPEWFDRFILDDVLYYCFLVIYNDSFGSTFYCPAETFDKEIESWLQEQLTK